MAKEPEFGCLDDLAMKGALILPDDMINIINQNCDFSVLGNAILIHNVDHICKQVNKGKNDSINDMINMINQNCDFPDKELRKVRKAKKLPPNFIL